MRAVVQRVTNCSVTVENKLISRIDTGLLVYLGVEKGDTEKDMHYVANKVSGLRIFNDEQDKMNLSIADTGGSILVVSQFTLCADTRKGNRPSYNNAAEPVHAEKLYNDFVRDLITRGFIVKAGKFQSFMNVSYSNIGPVTILIDSRKTF